MRISIDGVHSADLVKKISEKLGAEIVFTSESELKNPNFPIVDYSSKFYEHSGDSVVFDGGPFSGYRLFKNDGEIDLQEQIVLLSVELLDKCVIIGDGISPETLEEIKFYMNIFSDKIVYFESEDKINVDELCG